MSQRKNNRGRQIGPTKRFNLHAVSIKRGLERIVTEATDYELDILRAIHKEEEVQVVEENVGVREVVDDAYQVHAQLASKFNTKNRPIITMLFPTPQSLSVHTGLALPPRKRTDTGPKKSSQHDAKAEQRKREAQENLGIPASADSATPDPMAKGLADAAAA